MDSISLIDSHCHPYFRQFRKDADDVIQRALASGVSAMLSVGVDFSTFQDMMDLTEKYPFMYSTLGVHPSYRLPSAPTPAEFSDYYAEWMSRYPGKILGLGEMGLDYYRNYDSEYQRLLFRNQILSAVDLGLPIIVHTRNAREDTLEILEECHAERVGGVIHCFSEDWDFAGRVMDFGFMLSFSGVITMNGHDDTLEAVRMVPDNMYLVETDSPYLTPHPKNDRNRNEPSFVVEVASKVADVKGVDISKVARDSTDNFKRLFALA